MRNYRIGLLSAVAAALLLILATPARAQSGSPQPPGAQAPPAQLGANQPAQEEPPTEAEMEIDVAIKKVAAVKSVSADMAQEVKMLGQSFRVDGRYRKAPGSRLYLKLTVSGLPGSSGSMLQVCDGDVLWDYQQILEAQNYRRHSVRPIFERLDSPDMEPNLRNQILAQLGFAGPEALLSSVRKSVRFNQKDEGEIDGKPVLILRGKWKNRNGLVGPDQRPVAPMGMLPAYIPSIATLYIGKLDGWPYKIDLVGQALTTLVDDRQVVNGRKQGSLSDVKKRQQDPSEVHLVYSNVQLDADIPVADFKFQAPPNVNVEDDTEILVQQLDKALAYQAMQKKAEAAREGSTLKQSIEIPSAPPAAAEPPKTPN